MTRQEFSVQRAGENSYARYYRCSFGRDGREMVTVRVGKEGIFACLTCAVITCVHCRAAREFAETETTTPATRREDVAA